MRKTLIVIDAQEDFVRGVLGSEYAQSALMTIKDVVKYADQNDFTIFYTMDTHFTGYEETQEGKNLPQLHCLRFSEGWQLCKEAASTKPTNVYVISKSSFGTLKWQNEVELAGDEEIWLCGFCTDVCVSANFQILKACFPEVPIVVIEDACAGVTSKTHKAALDVIKSCQGKVMTWKELREVNKND